MKINVNILAADDGDFDQTVEAVAAAGAEVTSTLARIGVIRAAVDDGLIDAVAHLDGVQAVERDSAVRAT